MTRFIAEFYAQDENNRFDSFVQLQINNTVVFFNHKHLTHQTNKKIQNKKHVNSTPKVLSNTMFHISWFRTTDIHCSSNRVTQLMIRHQNCVFLINLQLYIVSDILLKPFSYLNKLIMKMKTVSKQQWQTSVRGYKIMCLPFYRLQIRTNQ